MGKVQLIGYWRSPASWRVEIMLKLKGIEYEFVEEDFDNNNKSTRSEEVLKYNPVYKKIPILVHDENPIAESLVIMEYIDETWKDHPLMPDGPYERAQARFWAKFLDDKILPLAQNVFLRPSEDNEKAKEELCELLKIFENEIKGKKYLGGNDVGYLDIVALQMSYWVPAFQEGIGNEIITRDKFPGIFSWCDELIESNDFIKNNLPDREKMVHSYHVNFAKA